MITEFTFTSIPTSYDIIFSCLQNLDSCRLDDKTTTQKVYHKKDTVQNKYKTFSRSSEKTSVSLRLIMQLFSSRIY